MKIFFSKSIKLVLLSLLFISIFSLFSYAADKEFSEGESIGVISGGALRVFNLEFQIRMNDNGSKIFVESLSTDDFTFIDVRSCKRIETFRMCYDRSSGNTAYVSLYSIAPDLTFEQEIEESETIIGDITWINVTILNEGEKDSSGLKYTFEVPPEIRVTSVEGAKRDKNLVYWNETLEKGKEHNLIIYFKPATEYKNLELVSKLIYYNYYDWVEDEISDEHDSRPYFEVDVKPRVEELKLGNPFIVDFNISNVYKKDSKDKIGNEYRVKSISLKENTDFSLGEEMETFTSFDGETAIWKGVLRNLTSREYSLEIIPKESGILSLPLLLEFYPTNTSNDTIQLYPIIELNIAEALVEVYPSLQAGETYNASRKNFFDIAIRNSDDIVSLSNIDITVRNKYGMMQRTIDELGTNSQKNLQDLYFITGSVNNQVSEELSITVTYQNSFFEEGEIEKTIKYYVEPNREIILHHNVTELGDGAYEMVVLAKNVGELNAQAISVSEELPENTFLRGEPSGTIEELKPGHALELAKYKFVASNLNFSKTSYLDVLLQYEMNNVTRVFSDNLNFTALIFDAVDNPESLIDIAKDKIEGVFFSIQIFAMFIASIIILVTTVTLMVMNKKEFSIGGINNLKSRQTMIDSRRKGIGEKETNLKLQKRKINTKISVLKSFMEKTKRELERKLPVLEEKKDGLELRDNELMREKQAIDDKIAELREIERKLLAKHKVYEDEKSDIQSKENELKGKFETVKSRLGELGNDFQQILDNEAMLNQRKETLNQKELAILAQKQKLLKAGNDVISDEKVNVLKEKIRLEHERNTIEEELYSLTNRKKDIESAQEVISKQQADIEKERNVFDMNKDAVHKAMESLQKQGDDLKHILEDSKHSDINVDEKKVDDNK